MKRFILFLFIIFSATFNLAREARSDIPLNGYFIANQSCEAFQSIKKQTNPGNVHLTEDMAYELISKNKVDATHYRIRIKQASPQERWVQVTCGTVLIDCRSIESDGSSDSGDPTDGSEGSSEFEYLLALSWQPAFCQTHQSKKECETQTEDRYDASHFALHGLWPQPQSNVYCNVTNNQKRLDKRKMWEQLPGLGLSEETFGDLMVIMPGVASYLHRHEWIKHGTCYSETPEEYYLESMMLTEQINASAIRDYFAENIGEVIATSEIKSIFDAAFGQGAGSKVRVKCSNGMISELWINLKGEINGNTQLESLLINAKQASSSCSEGIVDPVGY